ncbi:hypothetical protein JCM10213_000861 [Rhodosporidiobolus nylandii]
MLDRLPVELLQHILRLAAPLDYTPELYEERRANLRSCCLVSQRMRELAQPMLLEVSEVKTDEDIEALETNGRGKQVKLLAYRRVRQRSSSRIYALSEHADRLRRVLAACHLVRDVRYFDPVVDLNLLAPLSVRRVVFAGCWVDLTDAGITLPKLEELSMDATVMDSVEFGLLLRRCCLPALQFFAVTGVEPSDGAAFSSAISSGFFNSAKHIVLDAYDLARLPPSFPLPDPSQVLLTTSRYFAPDTFAPPFKPVHLAFYPRATLEYFGSGTAGRDAIKSFLPALSQHPTVRNLGIPDCLHPKQVLPSELASARDELLKACADNEVRVVWTTELTEWDSLVPHEFRAFLAEEAALREREAGERV